MHIPTNTPLVRPPSDYCPTGCDQWYCIPEGLDAGKTMFYSDIQISPDEGEEEAEGEPDYTLLFVHGNPENSYTYRHIREHLAKPNKSLRLISPDHIGFGLSDQCDFEMAEMHHAENLAQLVRHLDLQRVFLVVHDWGGPIGIGALLNEPQRVIGLCALNTSVLPMPSEGPTFRNYPFPWAPWYLTPNFIPDALWGGIAAALVPSDFNPKIVSEFLPAVIKGLWRYGRGEITSDQADYVWSEMFASKANARSSKQLVRQTASWGVGRPYTDKKHGLQDNRVFYRDIQAKLTPA